MQQAQHETASTDCMRAKTSSKRTPKLWPLACAAPLSRTLRFLKIELWQMKRRRCVKRWYVVRNGLDEIEMMLERVLKRRTSCCGDHWDCECCWWETLRARIVVVGKYRDRRKMLMRENAMSLLEHCVEQKVVVLSECQDRKCGGRLESAKVASKSCRRNC